MRRANLSVGSSFLGGEKRNMASGQAELKKGRKECAVPKPFASRPQSTIGRPVKLPVAEAGQTRMNPCLSPAHWTRNGVTMLGSAASHRSVTKGI